MQIHIARTADEKKRKQAVHVFCMSVSWTVRN